MQREVQITEIKRRVIFREFLACGLSVIYCDLSPAKNGCSPRTAKQIAKVLESEGIF